jgi:hypothetical protein
VAHDPKVHKRYLDYREVYGYFARGKPMLDYASFAAADAELGALTARGALDDEEEARQAELEALLFRD